MIKLFFAIFFLWLLYKLIFDFIIPVYNSTRQVRQQMSNIQQRMRDQYDQQQQSQYNAKQQQAPPPPRPDKGDYIDFEEIK